MRRTISAISPLIKMQFFESRFRKGAAPSGKAKAEPTQGAPPRFAGVIDRAGPAKPTGCSLGAVGGCCEFLALQFSAQDAATSIKLFETPIIGAHAPAQRHSV